jgi:hypothetical protein
VTARPEAIPPSPKTGIANAAHDFAQLGAAVSRPGNNRRSAMNQHGEWEAALEEVQVLFERQNRDFDTAVSLVQQAGDAPIEVDERSLRAFAESTTTPVSFRIALPQSNLLSGSRC